MDCRSYFLDAPMSRDLNMDATGSTCPPCRRGTAFEGEHYHNGFTQPQYLLYGKDMIKQTMLKQEEILMNQVAELHRLYETQTVIMNEFRSRKLLGRDCAKVDDPVQNPFRSELPPLDSNPQKMPDIPRMSLSNSPVILGYKGKQKMLDLSLPASEYMDCEEIELYGQDIVCDARAALHFPENKDSDVPLNHCGEVERFCSGDVLTAPEPSSSRLATLFDLNEPYQPDEVDISSACFQDFYSISHTTPDLDASSKKIAEEKQEKLPTGNYGSGKPSSNMNLFGSEMVTMPPESSQHDANEALELPVFFCPNQSKASWDEKTPCSLEAPDRTHRALKDKSVKKIKPPKIPKSHEIVPYQPNPESSVVTMRNYVNNVERRPIIIQALPCFSKGSLLRKKRKSKTSWDLIATGILEGPISPENEESARPRGDSTEKEIETVANGHLSTQEAKQAAEAIVSISSTKVLTCQNNGNHGSSAHCNTDALFLFASIASSSSSKDGLTDYFSGINRDRELDYFEMMTLEIPETKVGESLFVKKDYKEENAETILTQKTLKKGRGSIGKQLKNFQTELLPSIASLSRQEMKEDFRAIENLRAVTGPVFKKGKSSSRKRRRKSSTETGGNLVDELKLLERMHEMGSLEEGLPGWGKVHKRRRRPRFAPTNPSPIIVTQV